MPYKFTPNKWVIFDCQDGKTAIGYTTYRASKPIVVFTSDDGESGVMQYSEIVNPRTLHVECREANDIRKAAKTLPNIMINFKLGEA